MRKPRTYPWTAAQRDNCREGFFQDVRDTSENPCVEDAEVQGEIPPEICESSPFPRMEKEEESSWWSPRKICESSALFEGFESSYQGRGGAPREILESFASPCPMKNPTRTYCAGGSSRKICESFAPPSPTAGRQRHRRNE